MRATTIRLDGDLLAELASAKPANVTLTAFVRSILEREVTSTKLGEAADRYVAFLDASAYERRWLCEWGRADLTVPPKRRR